MKALLLVALMTTSPSALAAVEPGKPVTTTYIPAYGCAVKY